MSYRRWISLPVGVVLVTMITLAVLADPTVHQRELTGLTASPVDDLFAAVLPDHREATSEHAATMPRYTIAATFMRPPAELDVQPRPTSATPPSTPGATPQASPVASPITGPQASPVVFPITSPQASPMASPDATPVDVAPESAEADAPPTVSVSEAETVAEPWIVGTLDLDYINTTGEALDELYIRLYPNLRQYGTGRMVIANVQVEGTPVDVQAPDLHAVPDATPVPIPDAGAHDLAIIRIPLGDTLKPGDAISVRMDFSTTIPIDPPDDNGLFQYTPETGTWTLAHWFPMLAGHSPDTGWEIDPPAAWSDITFSNTALFDITLTAPDDLVLVTTGVETDTTDSAGHRTSRITTGPVRDVAIVAEPNLRSSSTEVGGTTVTSWYRPGEAAGGETILQWAAQSLEVFSDLFGPYPYTTLDIAPVPDAIGYEFPQLVFIGSTFYADPEALGSRPGAIEFLVVHEVAHQWWYGLIGSNPHRHAWLDEGLTEYSTILYFEQQYGDEVAASHVRDGLIHRYALMLATVGDQVVNQPTVDFPDAATYYATTYRKAGLGFEAVRHAIGDEAFFSALPVYADEHRFGVAAPGDLQVAFEEASGQDLDDVWTLWFESDRGRVEIVMEPLPATPPAATPVASPAEDGTPLASPIIGTPSAPEASPIASPIVATPPEPRASPVIISSASPVATPGVDTPVASPAAMD